MERMRLDKYLTQAAGLTRSEAKQYLKKGRVCVDGEVIKRPETKVDAGLVRVTVDGKLCSYEKYTYLMLNKPQGVISATEDEGNARCSTWSGNRSGDCSLWDDWIKIRKDFLLLTNDGSLAHALLSPRKHVDKCYYDPFWTGRWGGKSRMPLRQGLISEMRSRLCRQDSCPRRKDRRGLELWKRSRKMFPAGRTGGTEKNGVLITVQEGRFHQVKRMAKAVGREVLYLKRISMGSLQLDENLKPGQYRPLTGEEVQALKREITDRK